MKDKKTYIVDDDFIFRAASEVLIKSEKLTSEVATFENGLLALENLLGIAENSPEQLPDLLLLDINMPVMNGWEFLEALKEAPEIIRNQVDIFILTSSIAPEDLNLSKMYTFLNGYINKPLTVQDIQSLKER